MKTAVIKIQDGADYAYINQEVFDPKIHTEWIEPKRRPKKEKAGKPD